MDKVKQFIGDNNVLIITGSQNTKVSLKKIFSDFGVNISKIINADNFESAESIITKNPCAVILIDYILQEQCTRPLIDLFRSQNIDNKNSVLAVLAIEDSDMLKVDMHEYEFDHLFQAPFTHNNFQENILKLIENKMNRSIVSNQIDLISQKILDEDFDQVEELIIKIKENNKTSEIIYLEAKYYFRIGLFDKSINTLEEFTASTVDDYKTNMLLFDIFTELSEYQRTFNLAQKTLKYFPLHPKRIESYIKSALVTKSYLNVLEYGLSIDTFSQLPKDIFKAIAAGMVIAANHLLKTNEELVIRSAHKVLKISDTSLNMSAALNILLECGQSSEVRLFIESLGPEKMDSALKVIEYKAIEAQESAKNIYLKGVELVQGGIIEFSVYDIMIRSAVKVGRKKESVLEVIEDASRHYPDKKEYLRRLI